MPTARTFLIIAFVLSLPAAGHGQDLSQYRTAPFSDFDLTAIGIALVIVMIVLGFRALRRRRR